jgi:steroid 5-alpha reductase family enzyme
VLIVSSSTLQLIDLYWTVIPVMLLHYYRGHPASVADAVRSAVAVALTWLWSARLTHNYLRREGWEFGKREDWRFNEMRGQYGKTWWWMSFFAVYLSQQVMLLFTEFAFCFKLEITDRHHKTIHNLFIGTHSSLYNI